MTLYKVWAKFTHYVPYEVEANSILEARELVYEYDEPPMSDNIEVEWGGVIEIEEKDEYGKWQNVCAE